MSESQDLADCVVSWLAYKDRVGLSNLMNEASMAVPIAEFLAAKHQGEVKSEVNHPCFAKTTGRSKQIDFVRFKANKTWRAAYETKYKDQDIYRISADICRLACLAQDPLAKHAFRYFVYASPDSDETGILNKKITKNGEPACSYNQIFPLGAANREQSLSLKLTALDQPLKKPFKEFARRNNKPIPSIIQLTLLGWSEFGGFTCAIWKLLSGKGSVLLDAEQLSA